MTLSNSVQSFAHDAASVASDLGGQAADLGSRAADFGADAASAVASAATNVAGAASQMAHSMTKKLPHLTSKRRSTPWGLIVGIGVAVAGAFVMFRRRAATASKSVATALNADETASDSGATTEPNNLSNGLPTDEVVTSGTIGSSNGVPSAEAANASN